jgi:hypothetical protein
MTVMLAREIRLNLILSLSTAVLGLLLRLVGVLALKFDWFLPEYAAVTKGSGGTLFLIGLLWLGMALIKRTRLPREKTAR